MAEIVGSQSQNSHYFFKFIGRFVNTSLQNSAWRSLPRVKNSSKSFLLQRKTAGNGFLVPSRKFAT